MKLTCPFCGYTAKASQFRWQAKPMEGPEQYAQIFKCPNTPECGKEFAPLTFRGIDTGDMIQRSK